MEHLSPAVQRLRWRSTSKVRGLQVGPPSNPPTVRRFTRQWPALGRDRRNRTHFMRPSDPGKGNYQVNTEACTDVEFGAGPLTLTRRSLLQNSAWIAAASMFPRLAAAAAHDISPVMEQLSSYMAEARTRALPDDIVQ